LTGRKRSVNRAGVLICLSTWERGGLRRPYLGTSLFGGDRNPTGGTVFRTRRLLNGYWERPGRKEGTLHQSPRMSKNRTPTPRRSSSWRGVWLYKKKDRRTQGPFLKRARPYLRQGEEGDYPDSLDKNGSHGDNSSYEAIIVKLGSALEVISNIPRSFRIETHLFL